MRWQTPQELKHGSIRRRTFFAWTPVDVNGTTYWLELVTVVEEWLSEGMPSHWASWVVRHVVEPGRGLERL